MCRRVLTTDCCCCKQAVASKQALRTLADSEPARSMMSRKDRARGCRPSVSVASGRGELSTLMRRMVWLRLLSLLYIVALVCRQGYQVRQHR